MDSTTHVVHYMHLISVAILFLFLTEVSLHAICMGVMNFVQQPFLLLDFVVICVSLVFDLWFSHVEGDLLIVLRCVSLA